MKNKFKEKLTIIGASVLVVSTLSSCMNAKKTPESSSIPEPTTYTIETTTSEVPLTTTESIETSATGFTVETAPHSNPFGDYIFEDAYKSVAYNITRGGVGKQALYYGFDSPYIIEALQQELYDCTGVYDANVTLSDVGYFQYSEFVIENYGLDNNFYHCMTNDKNVSVEALRAILSSLGLRYGIDEIPASFLMERFPRFYHDAFEAETGLAFSLSTEVDVCDLTTLNSLTEITDDNYLDVVLWKTCICYNMYRVNCMYGHPYNQSGYITQVRDATTGQNVLVPTESEAELMQADINSVPGLEDASIYTINTPQDFYDDYGYYPDELLQLKNSVNTPENYEEYISSTQR